jgi:hypothetical protein
MIFALMCSAAAAVAGIIAKEATAAGIFAILSPLIAYIVANLKLDGKACWYFNRVNALDALRSRLQYELPENPSADNIAAIAHDRSVLVDTMEKMWDKQLVLDWSALSKPAHVMDFARQSSSSEK